MVLFSYLLSVSLMVMPIAREALMLTMSLGVDGTVMACGVQGVVLLAH